ncbi:MAG: hydantoinase B/oxoprolinase family protein, partial [Bauldia sp.]|nr:hydantoinase B/oxoprolinase family protein [Bauldia sp.]
ANIAAEMAIVMMKTSYSTIFNEGLDFSTMLLDRQGNIIAERNFAPAMMGAVNYTLRWTLEELGESFFEPGDVVVHNDPYRGNCHIPEHMLMKPIFIDGELIGFAGAIGHLAEVGGKAPGSFASDATDVYQEGLRLPPVKLLEKGEYNEQLWRVILANHRTPQNSWGDFHAMIGALNVGERRLRELVDRYDLETVIDGSHMLIDHAERRLRAEIEDLPDGRYEARMLVEDDGVGIDPFEVKVAVVIDGSRIIADFTGSSPQVRGPMNCTFVVAAAALYNAVFSVTDPHDSIPRNAGCYRPVQVIAPAGTVINVRHPGPSVGGNTDLQPKLIDLLLAALAKAVPERAAAATGGSSSNLLIGGIHPETGRYYSNYNFDGLGTGATQEKDGNDGEVTRHSNCRNTPIEVFEHRYPLVTLHYGLAQDSGGPGRRRGGLGVERILRVTAPEITVSALFDRCKMGSPGLFGGMDGQMAALLVKRKGQTEFRPFTEVFGVRSPSKFTNVLLSEGDELYYRSPGGAGFGPVAERDLEMIEEDLREGYIGETAARRDYGVEIREGKVARMERTK